MSGMFDSGIACARIGTMSGVSILMNYPRAEGRSRILFAPTAVLFKAAMIQFYHGPSEKG